MPSVVNPFPITMELYETDKNILQEFIETEKTEGIFIVNLTVHYFLTRGILSRLLEKKIMHI